MSGTNAITDHQTFSTLIQSHPFIHKTITENIHQYNYTVATTTPTCIKYHKIIINKLRLNSTLLANLTNLLHKENSYEGCSINNETVLITF